MAINRKTILLTSLIMMLAIPIFAQEGTPDYERGERQRKNLEMLQLTADQEDQMKTLRYEHEKKRITLQANLRSQQLELKRLKQSDDPNRRKIHAQVEKVGQARVDIGKSRADHQLEVRQILSKEQYKTFQKNRYQRGGKRFHHKGNHRGNQHEGKRFSRR